MTESPDWIKPVFVFLLGLEFGSFANVCIFRWPRGSSVVRPRRSFCPWCESPIRWYDNIPVLSFFLLRGRCRSCRSPISLRYPAVELTMGILWLGAYRLFGGAVTVHDALFFGSIFALIFTAIVTTLTDLDWRLIPDDATASLAAIGLLTAVVNPLLGSDAASRFQGALVGLVVGGGIIWMVGFLGEILFGKEAMGGGDVKLLAAVGTVIGWQGAVLTLFSAAFLGGLVAVVGLLSGRLKRRSYIPFGPFLNFCACLCAWLIHRQGKVADYLR